MGWEVLWTTLAEVPISRRQSSAAPNNRLLSSTPFMAALRSISFARAARTNSASDAAGSADGTPGFFYAPLVPKLWASLRRHQRTIDSRHSRKLLSLQKKTGRFGHALHRGSNSTLAEVKKAFEALSMEMVNAEALRSVWVRAAIVPLESVSC